MVTTLANAAVEDGAVVVGVEGGDSSPRRRQKESSSEGGAAAATVGVESAEVSLGDALPALPGKSETGDPPPPSASVTQRRK